MSERRTPGNSGAARGPESPGNPLILWDKDPWAVESLMRSALRRIGTDEASRGLIVDLQISLALAVMFQRRLGEARDLIRSILHAHPDEPSALWCDAQLSFYMSDSWPEAWKRLEARWGAGYSGHRPFPAERNWDGSPLDGRTVLFAGEGGLGDQVQFIRFAPLLRAAGAGRLIVSADSSLIPLFRSMECVDAFVLRKAGSNEPRDEVAFDAGVPMLSAPAMLGITRETLPAETPYLSVSADYVDRARARMGGDAAETFNVGLCWQSLRKFRSVPREVFQPLAGVPGVRLFGLGEQSLIEEECAALGITNLGANDICSTAGALLALDLVISADTMMVHLAGCLGRPVWLVLHYLADWRWPFEGETTPWYPTARLFRRDRSGWESVTRELVDALTAARLYAGNPL